jgi:hypothetical protein
MNGLRKERAFPASHFWRPLALVCCLAAVAGPSQAQVHGTFLYSLSNFDGRLAYDWPRVSVDQERDEVFVLYQNIVRIFNATGMETFSFGDDLTLGHVLDVTVDGAGDILLLSSRNGQPLVTRCDFRGVPIGEFQVRNLPDGLAFGANRLVFRNGLLYFGALDAARVVVTDADGDFREVIDLAPLLELGDRQPVDVQLVGFSVDQGGSIYFTIPVLFSAYRLSPDRKLESFGRPGSAPGRFGVIAGIVADSRGRVFVADKLKSVVMVFDKTLTFLAEFGYRGLGPANLVVPSELAIDGRDRLYVTQARKRGVSVFALSGE